MILTIEIAVGFILDLLFGDPYWLPHPIVYMGRAITALEKKIQTKLYGKPYSELSEPEKRGLIRDKDRELRLGSLLCLSVVTGSFGLAFVLLYAARQINPWLQRIIETFWIFQILACKSLKAESMKVYKKLKEGDLEGARTAISYLVGRDTKSLSEEEVVKAGVETIAENTSDGVVAPLFYLVIFGAPLGMAYKAINTLDSMIGYKNDEFLYLGRFAARLDDAANFIPSRFCALMMIFASFILGMDARGSIKIFRRDRLAHLSPNSAQTESVAAGALGIRLGGTHEYFGKPVIKPTIGDAVRPAECEDIRRCNWLLYVTSVSSLAVLLAIRSFILY